MGRERQIWGWGYWELGQGSPLSDIRGEASFLTRAPAKFFHSACLRQQLPAPAGQHPLQPPAIPQTRAGTRGS